MNTFEEVQAAVAAAREGWGPQPPSEIGVPRLAETPEEAAARHRSAAEAAWAEGRARVEGWPEHLADAELLKVQQHYGAEPGAASAGAALAGRLRSPAEPPGEPENLSLATRRLLARMYRRPEPTA